MLIAINYKLKKIIALMDNSHSFQGKKNFEQEKLDYFTKNVEDNKSYQFSSKKLKDKDLKNDLIKRFSFYRKKWNSIKEDILIKKKVEDVITDFPLCADIEIAAICDLACPFCYRQWILTPDKIMPEKLFYKLIEECGELGVPSVKLNWRGEPLLHPKISDYIKRCKEVGILEVLINTNATKLDSKMSEKLILSGLDTIIFSFDGGSEKTYNELRPGRFQTNEFKNVYNNIKNFSEIRRKMNSKFPRSKIQMILTEKTDKETKEFFQLFEGIVDDVSIKTYTERGGSIEEMDDVTKNKILNVKKDKINSETVFSKDYKHNVYFSDKRLPCSQPFQRLMVTYDGVVSLCCYDWGSAHPVGYVDELGFNNQDEEIKKLEKNIKDKKKGFNGFFDKAVKQKKFNLPEKKVSSLKEIWHGAEINKVRSEHLNGKINDVEICIKCPFKDTYNWKNLNEI
jgi:MoaA/NifB/PqqE/SkfB family radical SAM enzyme